MPDVNLIEDDGLEWVKRNKPEFILTDPPFWLMGPCGRICQDLEITRIYAWSHDWLSRALGSAVTDHPGEKEVLPYRRIIRAFDFPVICDPFMGSGSIGVAAVLEGRDFIGIEIDKKWLEVARGRLNAIQNTTARTVAV